MLQIAFSLDKITGATDIFDINGVVWSDIPKHTLCSVAKGTTNSKLFIPTKQVLLLEEIEEAIKTYGNGKPPITKPTAPSQLAVDGSPTATGFGAKWDLDPSTTKYTVAVSPTLAGYPKDVTSSKATFTGATGATEYTVSVKSCNSAGCSANATLKITTATADEPADELISKKTKKSKK